MSERKPFSLAEARALDDREGRTSEVRVSPPTGNLQVWRSYGQVKAKWQSLFIQETATATPEIWIDLKVKAGDLYTPALEVPIRRPQAFYSALRGGAGLVLSDYLNPGDDQALQELHHAIRSWQGEWNLNARFCEGYALASLHFWLKHWALMESAGQGIIPFPATLGSPYVDPRRFDGSAQGERNTKIERKQAGWRKATGLNADHLRWLVLYQCKGWTAASISSIETKFSCDDTVKKGYERAARALDLPLRNGARGPHKNVSCFEPLT